MLKFGRRGVLTVDLGGQAEFTWNWRLLFLECVIPRRVGRKRFRILEIVMAALGVGACMTSM